MRYILVLLFSFINVPGFATEPQTLVVIGDSLSAAYGINPEQGWVAHLQRRLLALGLPYHVVNASISGDTSVNGFNRSARLLKQHQPAIVLLELGANDGLRGFPIQTSRRYLEKIILACHQIQAQVVLIGTHLPPNYGADYDQAFYQMYHQLAAQYQLPLLPFLLEGVATHTELMQADGLHPTAQAQAAIEEHVWSILGPILQKP